ncbi:hypothetical protein [Bradyrhizobium sp. Ash2021]|uniref:hypothetical protein n=1 Tax=Bradyrhizobium sp. Ash2021 TaxID=2954771 RepID=UPI0028154288|nr:hypothetical protein [Bradyrhizobium sp. Ash2021]WMT78204.1 hypothetical protein NL528_18460 [Bradyrhizobium sp. Ash2021]
MTVSSRRGFIAAIVALVAVTGVTIAMADFAPPRTPSAAVEKIKERKADRIFNEYYFAVI